MKISYVSDLHLDSWNQPLKNYTQDNYLLSLLDFENDDSEILIIAGDISHYNMQIFNFLDFISKYYTFIIITFGNHEMYKMNYCCSFCRLSELIDLCSEIHNVVFLTGQTFTYNNITFGGTGGWYDFSYKNPTIEEWNHFSNDSNQIKHNDDFECPTWNRWHPDIPFHPLIFFHSEYTKLENIINDVDVLITHIGPIVPENIPDKYKCSSTGFYYFDGSKLLQNTKKLKYWIFGHTHQSYSIKHNDTLIVSNPIGYMNENNKNNIQLKTFII